MRVNYQLMLVCPRGLALVAQISPKMSCFCLFLDLPNFLPKLANFLHPDILHLCRQPLFMPTLSTYGLEVSQNWQFCPYLFRSNESLLWVQVHCCNEVAVACFERGTPCHGGDCEPISDIVRDQQATLAWPGCNLDILYISIILCIQAFYSILV